MIVAAGRRAGQLPEQRGQPGRAAPRADAAGGGQHPVGRVVAEPGQHRDPRRRIGRQQLPVELPGLHRRRPPGHPAQPPVEVGEGAADPRHQHRDPVRVGEVAEHLDRAAVAALVERRNRRPSAAQSAYGGPAARIAAAITGYASTNPAAVAGSGRVGRTRFTPSSAAIATRLAPRRRITFSLRNVVRRESAPRGGARSSSRRAVPRAGSTGLLAGGHQTRLVREDHGLGPVAQPQLGQDPADVGLHGLLGHDQVAGDLRVVDGPGRSAAAPRSRAG